MRDPNAAPTVRIVYPANKRAGYANIPAAEFDPAIHTLYEPRDLAASLDEAVALSIGRGPRGRWYVRRGKENVAGPFDTAAEAEAAK